MAEELLGFKGFQIDRRHRSFIEQRSEYYPELMLRKVLMVPSTYAFDPCNAVFLALQDVIEKYTLQEYHTLFIQLFQQNGGRSYHMYTIGDSPFFVKDVDTLSFMYHHLPKMFGITETSPPLVFDNTYTLVVQASCFSRAHLKRLNELKKAQLTFLPKQNKKRKVNPNCDENTVSLRLDGSVIDSDSTDAESIEAECIDAEVFNDVDVDIDVNKFEHML